MSELLKSIFEDIAALHACGVINEDVKQKFEAVCLSSEQEEGNLLTREALADVDAGRVVDHQTVQAWADDLDKDNSSDEPR